MGHAAHTAALNPRQLGEFLDQAGVIRPSSFGVRSMYKRRKADIFAASKYQLKMNRIKHNVAVRAKHGTKQDVAFLYSDGVVHSICNGSLASDGGR